MPYLYILQCPDDTYYTGSTRNLEARLKKHKKGEGANYTRKCMSVELVYYEEYHRIDEAYAREKQIQKWSHTKKKALIEGDMELLSLSAKKVWRRNQTS